MFLLQRRGAQINSKLGLFTALSCLAILSVCFQGCGKAEALGQFASKKCTYERLEYIQVLASPDELWFFLDIGKQTGYVANYGHTNQHFQPTLRYGGRQEVLVVSPTGSFACYSQGPHERFRFHPNLGTVFRNEESLYVCSVDCVNPEPDQCVLYRWRGDKFVFVTRAKRGGSVNSIPLSDGAMDALSRSNGWDKLVGAFQDSRFAGGDTEDVKWGKRTVRITKFEGSKTFGLTVLIEGIEDPIILSLDRNVKM